MENEKILKFVFKAQVIFREKKKNVFPCKFLNINLFGGIDIFHFYGACLTQQKYHTSI